MDKSDKSRIDDLRIVKIAIICVALIVLLISVTRCTYMGSTPGRDDVSRAIGGLEPACRPLAEMRIKSVLLRTGRPLTRRELDRMTGNLSRCDVIDAQMAGVTDGMTKTDD